MYETKITEAKALLEKVQNLNQSSDMPRRIELCQEALRIVDNNQHTELWGELQIELGRSLVQNPHGVQADNLEQAIDHFNQAIEVFVVTDFPEHWAKTQTSLALAYANRILGDPGENLEQTIDHYQLALGIYTRSAFPEQWARTQRNLGVAYVDRIHGDPANNIEKAIDLNEQALEVLTRNDFPEEWARTQLSLGVAFANRIYGNRADNLDEAINHQRQALEVYTREDFPQMWASVQGSLANAVADRVHGDPAKNIEEAIHHYQLALEVYNQAIFPEDWARTNNNLGSTYRDCSFGDRANNLELAIHHYEQALEVLTRDTVPDDWALTTTNLGNVYAMRIHGNRKDNLETAIEHCKEALDELDPTAFPQRWAMTQNSLGAAYTNRIEGDRADNLELAIYHYEQALLVRTRWDYPEQWAMTQNNLGLVYRERIHDERAENLEQAIDHFQQALEVYIREDFPEDWAMTVSNLGTTFVNRIDGDHTNNLDQAIEYYHKALEVYTQKAYPQQWAMTQTNLGEVFSMFNVGEWTEDTELAIQHYENALKVYTRTTFPEEWANIHNSLGAAYEDAALLEQAIPHFQNALMVYTRNTFPFDWAMTHSNLYHTKAELYSDEGGKRFAQAIDKLEEVFEVYTRNAFPEDYKRIKHGLADLLFQQNNWAVAHEAYTEAIETGADLLAAAYTETGRLGEVGGSAQIYAKDAYCLMRLGRPADSLLRLEQGKTRLLNEALALDEVDLAMLPKADEKAMRAARKSVQDLEAKMRSPMDIRTHHDDRVLAESLRQARVNLNQLIEKLRSEHPNFMPSDLSLTELLDLIPEGGALVAPFFTAKGSAVFVLPHGTGAVTENHVLALDHFTDADLDALLTEPDDEQELDGWLNAYAQFAFSPDVPFFETLWSDTLEITCKLLWDRLFGAVHDQLTSLELKPAAPVLLMPQGGLGLLPLHASWRLINGRKRYFLDDWTVTYVSSGYALNISCQRLCEPQRQEQSLLAVVYNTEDLPFSPAERDAVMTLFSDARLLENEMATVSAVLNSAAGCQYLHFACHGGFDWIDVMQSALFLADNEPLTLSKVITKLDLSAARLVTLSACETGITEFGRSPDEYLGLPAGFLQAGAPAVISSLWPVNDLSTSLLMERFYQNMLGHESSEPQPPAEALRTAQCWLQDITVSELQEKLGDELSDDDIQLFAAEISHPHHWAAFTFSGA